MLLVLGDFNARVLSSSGDDDWSSVLGKFGLSERNAAGERLLMWC